MKILPRALIEPEFVDIYSQFIENSIVAAKEEIPMIKGETMRRSEEIRIAKLQRVLSGTAGERGSLDHEMTRLRRLPIQRYYVEHTRAEGQYPARVFLAAKTQDILLSANYKKKHDWNLGEYVIGLPLSNPTAFDLVPLRDPLTINRHPHHLASLTPGVKHPFNMKKRNCLAGFATIITNMARDGEIAELFMVLHRFLSNWNPGSPLKRPQYIAHAHAREI